MISDGTYEEFECALSIDKHFLFDPIILTACGHSVCKNCAIQNDNKPIKCNVCGVITDRDVRNDQISLITKKFLKSNLKNLLLVIEKQTLNSFNKLKNFIDSKNETIDVHIEYIKAEIEIRIESIKIELDKIQEEFNDELEKIKNDLKLSESNHHKRANTDMKNYEIKLNQLRNDLQNDLDLNDAKLNEYQKSLQELNRNIDRLTTQNFRLNFNASNDSLNKSIVGRVVFGSSRLNEIFEEKVKNAQFEIVTTTTHSYEICVLPNGYLLSANYSANNLTLYDENLKLIKTIDKINQKTFQPSGIISNENDRVYISNYLNGSLIMTDLDFNEVKTYGSHGSGPSQFQSPHGICYANNRVYVCDYINKRLHELKSWNLEFVKFIPVDYSPWKIKQMNNLVAVTCGSASGVYFYDLDTFKLKHKYNHKNCKVFPICKNFYSFDVTLKRLYCFDSDGNLTEDFQLGREYEGLTDWYDGCVVHYGDSIVISFYSKTQMLKIKL